jgi:hypothetical protein
MTRLRWAPRSRSERRRARRETKLILSMLMPIEIAFNNEILDTEAGYVECYKHYLAQWNAAIASIYRKDIRIVSVNETYFADQFRAVE